MFDLSGRIILEDAFSVNLQGLISKSEQAGNSLVNMGAAGDAGMAKVSQRTSAMVREAERLRGINPFQALRVEGGTLAGLERLAGGAQQVAGAAGVALGPLGMLGGMLGPAGLIVTGAAAAGVAIFKLVSHFGQLGEESAQLEARFTAFSGGVANAGENFNALDKAVGNALSRDEKMVAISRVMSLNLAENAQDMANLVRQALILGDATAPAEQKIDSLTQILVTGRLTGLYQYGISVQEVKARVVELQAATAGLSDAEARNIAIKEALARKAAEVEKAGGLPATAKQEADKARADFFDAIGDLSKAGEDARQKEIKATLLALTALVQGKGQQTAAEKELDAQRAALRQTTEQLANAEILLANAKQGGNAAAIEERQAAVDELQALKAEQEAKQQSTEIDLVAAEVRAKVNAGLYEGIANTGALANAVTAYGKAQREANDATDAFQAAGGRSVGSAAPAQEAAAQLGAYVKQLAELSNTAIKAPEMPRGMLEFDAGPWREYIAAMREAGGPAVETAANTTQQWVDKLGQERAALLSSALALSSHRAGLQLLAGAYGGASGGIDELLANFGKLPADVQSAIVALDGVGYALDDLQAKAAKPISIDIMVNGLSGALGDIDQMALRLAGTLDPTQIRAFRDQARAEVSAHWTEMEGLDKFGMELEKGVILKGYSDIVDGTLQSYRALEAETKNHYTNLADSAQGLKSMIESALQGGLEVTPEQMLAAQAGKYQNVALENARRLQAIAERGFAEIKAHPDWANILKIPSEVLNGGEDGLKAWAARIKGDVTDLTRPDLIDWDAFIRQFQADQDRTAAKGLTIDIAVGKLKDSGLLKGMTDEERKKKVAAALGMSAPEVTLDTLFAPKGTPGDLVKKFLGDKDAMEIPIKWIYPAGPAGALPENSGMMPPGSTPVAAKQPEPTAAAGKTPAKGERVSGADRAQYLLDTQGAEKAPALTSSAATAASSWILAFQQGIKDTDPAMQVATALNTEFGKNTKAFTAMGNEAGGTVGDAFITGVTTKAGGVVQKLAEIIAPEVAKILQRQNSGNSKP